MSIVMVISLFIGLLALIRGAWLDHKSYFSTTYEGHAIDRIATIHFRAALVLIFIPMIYWI